ACCFHHRCSPLMEKEHVSESQLPKIHTALGHSLVHKYTEAYTEVKFLLFICTVLSDPTSNRKEFIFGLFTPSSLADPPAVKELVRAEVRMLLQTLRERAGRYEECKIVMCVVFTSKGIVIFIQKAVKETLKVEREPHHSSFYVYFPT
uniref:Uncharacterized protein n=1 Tax=Neogobius melanostomus TaxID=47308 RepID=A0A8C6ULC8_9GOBI